MIDGRNIHLDVGCAGPTYPLSTPWTGTFDTGPPLIPIPPLMSSVLCCVLLLLGDCVDCKFHWMKVVYLQFDEQDMGTKLWVTLAQAPVTVGSSSL